MYLTADYSQNKTVLNASKVVVLLSELPWHHIPPGDRGMQKCSWNGLYLTLSQGVSGSLMFKAKSALYELYSAFQMFHTFPFVLSDISISQTVTSIATALCTFFETSKGNFKLPEISN